MPFPIGGPLEASLYL